MTPQRPIPSSLLLMSLRLFRKLCACGASATVLCDWKDLTHKSGTCDEPICHAHAKEVLPGKFLCPRHWLLHDRARKKFSASQQEALFAEAA